MNGNARTKITITAAINASAEQVWQYWTQTEHITKWNQASEGWHTPRAESDLRVGGRFMNRMESKDGKYGFDFWGVYDAVEPPCRLDYTIGDGRTVQITFQPTDGGTYIVETFEAESENSVELQRQGWQAILDSFKKYVENQ
ncbi:MAG: SRPBCC family protein [Eubacteriales bacterium]|nr:SRPBCC family protein [Eubacteriales bacterium]